MAEWRTFNRDVDYRHKSGAVTAYKAGNTVYLPRHIATDTRVAAASDVAEKPELTHG